MGINFCDVIRVGGYNRGMNESEECEIHHCKKELRLEGFKDQREGTSMVPTRPKLVCSKCEAAAKGSDAQKAPVR